jgi:hypothetical protein
LNVGADELLFGTSSGPSSPEAAAAKAAVLNLSEDERHRLFVDLGLLPKPH